MYFGRLSNSGAWPRFGLLNQFIPVARATQLLEHCSRRRFTRSHVVGQARVQVYAGSRTVSGVVRDWLCFGIRGKGQGYNVRMWVMILPIQPYMGARNIAADRFSIQLQPIMLC